MANEQTQAGINALSKGDAATAVELLERALGNDPNNTSAKSYLTDAKAKLREQREYAAEAGRVAAIAHNFARGLIAAPSVPGMDFAAFGAGRDASGRTNSAPLNFDSFTNRVSENRAVNENVVDAREVPSGLPPSVESQIEHSEAGNRVRKGYQSIATHDWDVALAWFRDAANYKPGDVGIRRLIELAEYTIEFRKRQISSSELRVLPDSPMLLIDRYVEQRNSEIFQAQWKVFVDDYLPSHPQEIAAVKDSLKSIPSKRVSLSDFELLTRTTDLRRAADQFAEDSVNHIALSLALMGADSNNDRQTTSDLAVLEARLYETLTSHALSIEKCKCESPLELPDDSQLKFLLPALAY